ncbi:PqqD family peptide modification chaperone [Acidobacteriota bacterium]
MGEQTLIIPITAQAGESDALYTLNETGRTIWDLIDGERTAAQVSEALAQEYDITLDEAGHDVTHVLEALEGAGLIRSGQKSDDREVEEQGYGDFSLGLHRQVLDKRAPLSGAIEVTRRCSLRCVHCYNNLPAADRSSIQEELTLQEYHRIIDEIADAGCLWLLFTGGEIFLRKDFLEIYTYAKQKGMLITLFTNGTLLTPSIADRLAELPPFAIEMTLYGRTSETFDCVTGVPGSYERSMKSIGLLIDRNLPLKLKATVMTLNKHEIWDMKQYVEEDLGVSFRFDAMLNCRLDCSPTPLAVRLDPEEIVALDLQDPRRIAEWRDFAARFNGPVKNQQDQDKLYHCGAGMQSFAVDPTGNMRICLMSQGDAYDLRQGSFQQGWDEFLLKERRKRITRVTKCTACEIKSLCGMCPVNGELENGDPEEPSEFLCSVAQLRCRALDLPGAYEEDNKRRAPNICRKE